MNFEMGEYCFINLDDWTKLETYTYAHQDAKSLMLYDTEGKTVRLPLASSQLLCVHPFSPRTRQNNPAQYSTSKFLLDLASSLISRREKITPRELIELMLGDARVRCAAQDIELLLKSLVANHSFSASLVTLKKTKVVYLAVGEQRQQLEKQRLFAASIASELDALSQRVRLIVSHAGTVGTYRESLLQNVLKKHLPERYHVAFGFIYGCPRQLDILIYDRLEYAPLFREGDLVVVPANAVRAVIEVKTNLTTARLSSSLSLLSQVSVHDDGLPPIFKGIFAFESDLTENSLCKHVTQHYKPEDDDAEETLDSIWRPYDHLTCVCVLERHYVYTGYKKSTQMRLMPILYSKKSNTGLPSQVAFFMRDLLAHLRYGGAKNNYSYTMDDMLGSDTIDTFFSELAVPNWGPYFGIEHGTQDDEEIEETEKHITSVQNWLIGATDFWALNSQQN